MKIFKIKASGLYLLKDELEIDFYAEQRVSESNTETMTNVFSNFYINNVISFNGVNASGKTTILKIIAFVINMLNNEPIHSNESNDILKCMKNTAKFEVYFYGENNEFIKLETIIGVKVDKNTEVPTYFIERESLWKKDALKIKTKKSLFDFDNLSPFQIREKDEEFLMDDVSIIISYNKKNNSQFILYDRSKETNINVLHILGNFPSPLINFLDPSIESLVFKMKEKDFEIKLKFYEENEIILFNPMELNNYLSSGTIKGLNVFISAMMAFKNGGYFILDEIENHFHHEIVSTLIRLFMDKNTNALGAVLLYSTHYAELLDEFDRSDNIYIIKNNKGIYAKKLSKILNRNDIKKSEAYASGFLEMTTPSYKAYINLKKSIQNAKFDLR
ncbi:AAA family ATPase [Amedibacillus sp. YH-ame6]